MDPCTMYLGVVFALRLLPHPCTSLVVALSLFQRECCAHGNARHNCGVILARGKILGEEKYVSVCRGKVPFGGGGCRSEGNLSMLRGPVVFQTPAEEKPRQ